MSAGSNPLAIQLEEHESAGLLRGEGTRLGPPRLVFDHYSHMHSTGMERDHPRADGTDGDPSTYRFGRGRRTF
jgi:hypothetical protein